MLAAINNGLYARFEDVQDSLRAAYPWFSDMVDTGLPRILIACEEAAKLPGGKSALFIDARSSAEYRKDHIPGAVNVDLFSYHWVDTSPSGLKAFARHMEIIFSYAGVSTDRKVVFYEDVSGSSAAKGVWLLHWLGHRKAMLLDGGLRRWRKMKLPVDSVSVAPSPSKFKADLQMNLVAGSHHVASILNKRGRRLLETRSPEEYFWVKVRAARGGCIPGAVNVNWERNLRSDGTLKDPEELETLFREAGLDKSDEIVTYCQGGYRAAHAYLALLLAGYTNVRNYVGSWGEWGNKLDLPVEVPKKK
ncbi:MAG: sulfurtransferase [Thaumarchaeota archaeon]|nr:sulfurtransferase [Nitrososphaerota archaeon]